MKMFIVGDSGAGKTSFCRWIQHLPFESRHLSTEMAQLTTININTNNWNQSNNNNNQLFTNYYQLSTFSPPSNTTTNQLQPQNQQKSFKNVEFQRTEHQELKW